MIEFDIQLFSNYILVSEFQVSIISLLSINLILSISFNSLIFSNYINLNSNIDSNEKKFVLDNHQKSILKDNFSKLKLFTKDELNDRNRKLIAIQNYVFDIKNFIEKHPGGTIIERQIGKESTNIFVAMHKDQINIIKKRIPIGIYNSNCFEEKYLKYSSILVDNNILSPNIYITIFQIFMILICIIIAVSTIQQCPSCSIINGIIWGTIIITSGQMTHDCCHNITFKSKHLNRLFGFIFGDIIFGVSSRWWKQEHDQHHAIPLTYDENGITDVQNNEALWFQSEKVMHWFRFFYSDQIIPYQHIYTLPVALVFGRIGIMVDCWVNSEIPELRIIHIIGLVIHWYWIVHLCSLSSSPLVFQFTMSTFQGFLGVFLILNHMCGDWEHVNEVDGKVFPKRQTEINCNVNTYAWADQIFGGLNLHIEHHLYPTMPRFYQRLIKKDIKKLLKDSDLEQIEYNIFKVLQNVYSHLKNLGEIFANDSRHYKEKHKN